MGDDWGADTGGTAEVRGRATCPRPEAAPPMAAALMANWSYPLRVVPCSSWSGDASSDGWFLSKGRQEGMLELRNLHPTPLCLDAGNGSVPMMSPCDGRSSQLWKNASHATGSLVLQSAAGRCLMAAVTSYTVGPGLLLSDCDQGRPGYGPPLNHAMEWAVTAAAGGGSALRSTYSACCGDIFETRPVCLAIDRFPSCASPNAGAWCDSTLEASARAKALVARMTLQEKASNMDSENFGVPRLGVPPNVFSEALHGFVGGCGKKVPFGPYVSTGCPTSFPQVISMGATWNRSLWTAVGTAVSDETRGLYSQGSSTGWEASLFLWAPNVNPFRDPRWGRGQEVPSEEPLVCAEYAAYYIPALQGGVTSGSHLHLKTVATVKHFFDYDLEGHGTTDRQRVDVNVSARDQTEYFLPSFEAAVKRGNSHSLMCSYNAVNGVPACFTDAMINGKLRGEWKFDGFVVSDCDALSDGASHDYIVKHFNGSLQVQAQQALRGGTDLNCGALYGEQNAGAVRSGLLKESELDTALERIFTKSFQLGIPDGP